ncbi:MAG: amidohydrolase family protein, partial [Actinomycetota bacterium]
MNECCCSADMGVPGWPAIAEEMMVSRDIELVRLTGARVHFLHLSTARSVDLVRGAKADGLPVTAEVTPHHLSLTEEMLTGFDPVYKVNPPLRSVHDIRALKIGLVDGTIDAIATDHAPHARRDKELPLDQAPPGMLGLETALGVVLAELDMDLPEIVALLSTNPATIAGIAHHHGGNIAPLAPANLCVFDPQLRWQVDLVRLASKSTNTPFVNRNLRGKVRHTVFRGDAVVIDGEAQR